MPSSGTKAKRSRRRVARGVDKNKGRETMSCEQTKTLLEPFLDGALAPDMHRDVRAHIETCLVCRREAEKIQAFEDGLRAALRDDLRVPETLLTGIQAALDAESLAAPAAAPTPPAAYAARPQRRRLVVFGGLAAAALAGVGVVGYAARRPDVLPVWLLEAPVYDLKTYLASSRPIDFATANPAELHLWFAGKLDFQPPKPPQPDRQVELMGGRLCYFLHRRAASYMYRADGHLVSLFFFREAGLGMPTGGEETVVGQPAIVRRVEGFTHVLWNDGGLIRSLVSDLPEDELLHLAAVLLSAES